MFATHVPAQTHSTDKNKKGEREREKKMQIIASLFTAQIWQL